MPEAMALQLRRPFEAVFIQDPLTFLLHSETRFFARRLRLIRLVIRNVFGVSTTYQIRALRGVQSAQIGHNVGATLAPNEWPQFMHGRIRFLLRLMSEEVWKDDFAVAAHTPRDAHGLASRIGASGVTEGDPIDKNQKR